MIMLTDKDVRDWKCGLNKETVGVHLFNVKLDSFNYPSDADSDLHKKRCYNWCIENLGEHGALWGTAGVTVYSWKIIFARKEDAVAFKLTFGL
jgi:hypothetical protein